MMRLARSDPVGVVGAGTMGAGIAQVAALAGHPVLLFDDDGAARERAVEAIARHFERAVAHGRVSVAEAEAAAGRLQVVATVEELADCAVVVEAIVEDVAAKRSLFATLEKVVRPTAILASNTSSLSIDDLTVGLDAPGRVLGLHFFNPAPLMPLVEVVSATSTDAAVADAAATLVTAWGKTPVRASSTPGFIVNRVARPFYAEGFRLLAAGVVDPATLDALLREAGGFRMGPCELTDLIGQDVNAAVTRSMWEAFDRDPRFETSGLQQSLVDDGRLGRKRGHGWYDYRHDEARPEPSTAPPATVAAGESTTSDGLDVRVTDGRSAAQHSADAGHPVFLVDLTVDPATASRVGLAAPPGAAPEQVEAAIGHLQRRGQVVTLLPDVPGLVVARTVAMLAAFAADAVDSGVASAADVDTAMRLGVNYPRGPYAWGELLGWHWVAGVLDALAAAEDPQRYRVSPGLRDRAADGADDD